MFASHNTRVTSSSQIKTEGSHQVLLVHGLGAHRLLMTMLSARLRQAGYEVINWGYPSFRSSIAQHGERLRELLLQLDNDPAVAHISLVTHSLGGIVARAALVGPSPQGSYVEHRKSPGRHLLSDLRLVVGLLRRHEQRLGGLPAAGPGLR